MPGIDRRRLWLGAALAVVVTLGLGIAGYSAVGGHKTGGQRIGVDGGTAWNSGSSVGVRIGAHGVTRPTTVAFRKPSEVPPESPLTELVDVVVPAVNIVADSQISEADVIFVLDPAVVPAAPPSGTVTNQRTIANAGIEVFNDVIGVWIPIPTTVEDGNRLAARAPHFSLFRAVWNKLGEVAVKVGRVVKVVLTTAMKPIDLLRQTGLALARTTFDSLLGRFDNSKYDCTKRNRTYSVTVTDDTKQGKLDACVVQSAPDRNQLLIKNALAVPFRFSSSTPGLVPDIATGEMDLLSVARSLTGTLTGDAYASGLDVAAFNLASDAPKRFTVKGELAWESMAVEFTVGVFMALLPASKVAVTEYRTVVMKVQERLAVEVTRTATRLSYTRITEITEIVVREQRVAPTLAGQVQNLMSLVECAVTVGQKLVVNDWHNLPGQLADIARRCLIGTLKAVGEAKDAIELLKGIASEARLLPALGQLAAIDILNLVTGTNVAQVTFAVVWLDPATLPFLGKWHAHGANLALHADGTGTFWSNYGPCLPTFVGGADMCAENWAFTFAASGGTATGKVTKVWITTWDGAPPPADFDDRGTTAKVGDGLQFSIPDRRDIIRMNADDLTAEFCNTSTSAYDTGRCGG